MAELVRNAADDMIGRCLCAHIGGVILEHDRCRRGRNLQERATVAHAAEHGLIKQDCAGELQRGDRFEIRPGGIQERLEQSPAGCVERNIEPAKAINRGLGESLEILRAGNVADYGSPTDFGRQNLELRGVTPGHH